jgi:hypothetical protein
MMSQKNQIEYTSLRVFFFTISEDKICFVYKRVVALSRADTKNIRSLAVTTLQKHGMNFFCVTKGDGKKQNFSAYIMVHLRPAAGMKAHTS